MKKLIFAIIIFVSPILICAQDIITVTGSAVVKVVPDKIYLRIQISEKQKNRADLEATERKMITDLGKINIDVEKDMVISELANNFRSLLFSDDNMVISKEYILLVRNTQTANKVISVLDRLAISNIKVDHLDNDKLDEYKSECIVNAIKAAKGKADAMTAVMGRSVGRALAIEEQKIEKPQELNAYERYAFKGETYTSSDWFVTDLDFKEIRIEYSVLAKFELK